jgi:hypothetical protein
MLTETNFMFSIRKDRKIAEEKTSDELMTNWVGMSATGCCAGVENGKTKQK